MTDEVSNRAPSVEELRVLQRRIAEISGVVKKQMGGKMIKKKNPLYKVGPYQI